MNWIEFLVKVAEVGASTIEHMQFLSFVKLDRDVAIRHLASVVRQFGPQEFDRFEVEFLEHCVSVIDREQRLRALELYALSKTPGVRPLRRISRLRDGRKSATMSLQTAPGRYDSRRVQIRVVRPTRVRPEEVSLEFGSNSETIDIAPGKDDRSNTMLPESGFYIRGAQQFQTDGDFTVWPGAALE
jgi:hypothetical protein